MLGTCKQAIRTVHHSPDDNGYFRSRQNITADSCLALEQTKCQEFEFLEFLECVLRGLWHPSRCVFAFRNTHPASRSYLSKPSCRIKWHTIGNCNCLQSGSRRDRFCTQSRTQSEVQSQGAKLKFHQQIIFDGSVGQVPGTSRPVSAGVVDST